jgi:hypothetical protein
MFHRAFQTILWILSKMTSKAADARQRNAKLERGRLRKHVDILRRHLVGHQSAVATSSIGVAQPRS